MARKRSIYEPKLTIEGHYGSHVNLGRKDRAHVKLVYDTQDWLPYGIIGTSTTQTVKTYAKEIIMNSPYQVAELDSLNGTAYSFCGPSQVNAQGGRLIEPKEQLVRYGSMYERFCVTSCKVDIACRSMSPLTLDVDEKGQLSDPALIGPQQVVFYCFPFPPTLLSTPTVSGGALFTGNSVTTLLSSSTTEFGNAR